MWKGVLWGAAGLLALLAAPLLLKLILFGLGMGVVYWVASHVVYQLRSREAGVLNKGKVFTTTFIASFKEVMARRNKNADGKPVPQRVGQEVSEREESPNCPL